MEKRFFNLYEKIVYPLNIWAAYKLAAKGKRYRLSAAPFRDRVVHQALMNVIEPFFSSPIFCLTASASHLCYFLIALYLA